MLGAWVRVVQSPPCWALDGRRLRCWARLAGDGLAGDGLAGDAFAAERFAAAALGAALVGRSACSSCTWKVTEGHGRS